MFPGRLDQGPCESLKLERLLQEYFENIAPRSQDDAPEAPVAQDPVDEGAHVHHRGGVHGGPHVHHCIRELGQIAATKLSYQLPIIGQRL